MCMIYPTRWWNIWSDFNLKIRVDVLHAHPLFLLHFNPNNNEKKEKRRHRSLLKWVCTARPAMWFTSKVWIRKLSGKDAVPLALKTIEALQPIKDLIHTITADNGKEFAKHQEIAEKLEISFYFCKPFRSWERGANENMNGLIRQYISKGTDFSGITDEFVSWVEDKLNNRPRKRLGYLIPNEKFNLWLTG